MYSNLFLIPGKAKFLVPKILIRLGKAKFHVLKRASGKARFPVLKNSSSPRNAKS